MIYIGAGPRQGSWEPGSLIRAGILVGLLLLRSCVGDHVAMSSCMQQLCPYPEGRISGPSSPSSSSDIDVGGPSIYVLFLLDNE